MKSPARRVRVHFSVVAVAILLVILSMVVYRRKLANVLPLPLREHVPQAAETRANSVQLVAATNDTLRVEQDAVAAIGIRSLAAQPANLADTLQLSGTLTLDASWLEEVRSRFQGEVVEIGKTPDGTRSVVFGDSVRKDQLLAVVWSRELVEKKSELVDAISQLHLDTERLKRLEKLFQDGTLSERDYRDAQRALEADRIAVSRVLLTLQTWRVADAEIKQVEEEAQRLVQGGTRVADQVVDKWARVEVRAALDGLVLERNVSPGEIISVTDDLFKVADVSRLRVLAFAYEEDLPRLDTLASEHRRWRITIPADPSAAPQTGQIEQIGRVIDPMQHTALVMGWVDNANGRLRAGQFVTAIVELPAPGNEVAVPASAIIEKGGERLVFVQAGTDNLYRQRRVSFSRQVDGTVCVHIQPTDEEVRAGCWPLNPGEKVVVSGAVELQQCLTDLKATATASDKQEERPAEK
jgi:membrane fusion protein, heavy metal efflux system